MPRAEPKSAGEALYEVHRRTMTTGELIGWDLLKDEVRDLWKARAAYFLDEMNTQSSQHFSRRAEMAVRDLENFIQDGATEMWVIEFQEKLDALFDLLPDSDAELIRKIRNLIGRRITSDEDAKAIIEAVRGTDAR